MLFSKIYVINLARRKDRRTQVEETLKSVNIPDTIPIEYIEAVDGQALPPDNTYNIIENFTDPASGRIMTKGEIGCSLSHQLVFEKAYKEMNDSENILILEDDLVIDPYFLDEVNQVEIQSKKIDFDFIYLGRKKVNEDMHEEKISDILVKPNYSYWTSSILYSKKAFYFIKKEK